MKLNPIKVSQLNKYIKKHLSNNALLNNLYVEGEILNYKVSKNNITYFTLRESDSCINCICFFREESIKNGDKIIVAGNLNVYEQRGTYQINVKEIEKIGTGNILKELELLMLNFKNKGMFSKNKIIPKFPKKIGIVTSKNGAAIKDILKTFDEVSSNIEIYIYNTTVQGDIAKKNIIEGIKYFNEIEKTDVIMICRGGGSFEDLTVFNDTDIAQNIYNSLIPIVTGIGHESDRTLSDFIADLSCHTPTAAAIAVIEGYKNIQIEIDKMLIVLKNKMSYEIDYIYNNLRGYKYAINNMMPLAAINNYKHEVLNYSNILIKFKTNKLNYNKYNLELYKEKINNYNYKNNLEKGYALVLDKDGNIINNISNISKNKLIDIIFNKFKIQAEIKQFEEVNNVK